MMIMYARPIWAGRKKVRQDTNPTEVARPPFFLPKKHLVCGGLNGVFYCQPGLKPINRLI